MRKILCVWKSQANQKSPTNVRHNYIINTLILCTTVMRSLLLTQQAETASWRHWPPGRHIGRGRGRDKYKGATQAFKPRRILPPTHQQRSVSQVPFLTRRALSPKSSSQTKVLSWKSLALKVWIISYIRVREANNLRVPHQWTVNQTNRTA